MRAHAYVPAYECMGCKGLGMALERTLSWFVSILSKIASSLSSSLSAHACMHINNYCMSKQLQPTAAVSRRGWWWIMVG